MLAQIKNYTPSTLADWRLVGKQTSGEVTSSLHVTQTPYGYARVAELHRPTEGEKLPGILFVHWYEPESPTSNRRQFEAQAMDVARQGAVCLLVETMWSDMDFFVKRTQADDIRNSVEETINLRRALDFLLAQPGVDAGRVALVGHDFGGMYGVLMGSLDKRPTHYVIMAATPRFPDWYLYAPKLEGAAREQFIASMTEYDPITHIANLAPAPILFQFGTADPHVPRERAEEFFAAAREPKTEKWYEAGHGLDDRAAADRLVWLQEQLHL